MTPRSFDAITSREMTGDGQARGIEAKARADADRGQYDPPPRHEPGNSYWADCQLEFKFQTYFAQYSKRLARNQRKAIA